MIGYLDRPEIRTLLQKIGSQASKLWGGTTVAAGLGMVSTAIVAHSLSQRSFGILSISLALVEATNALTNFQTWQATVKFGKEALSSDDPELEHASISAGFLLDWGTSLLALIILLISAGVIAEVASWDHQVGTLAVILALPGLVNVRNGSKGVLRLYERFGVLGRLKSAGSGLRLLAVTVVAVTGGSLRAFGIAYAASIALTGLLYAATAWHVWRKQVSISPVAGFGQTVSLIRRQRYYSFALSAALNKSLRLPITYFDTMLVGTVLGEAASGSYKLIKTLSKGLRMSFGPVEAALYPSLANLVSEGEIQRFVQTGLTISAVAALAVVPILAATWFFGDEAAVLIGGAQYSHIGPALFFYVVGISFQFIVAPIYGGLLALELPRSGIPVYVAAATLYMTALIVLSRQIGLAGAAGSYLVYYLVWATGCLYLIRRRLGEME